MTVSFEKIDELRKRAHITYEEAKNLLEKHNGNMVDAMIELEKNKKTINSCAYDEHAAKFTSKLKKLYKKGNITRFVVMRKGEAIINVPVNCIIVGLIMAIHFMIFSLVLILITGCKISIQKSEGCMMDLDDALIDVSQKIKNAAKDFDTSECNDSMDNNGNKDSKDGNPSSDNKESSAIKPDKEDKSNKDYSEVTME